MATAAEIAFAEVSLRELRASTALWQQFLEVQAPWRDAGVVRWFELLRPEGPHPALLIAARRPAAPGLWLGTIVGIWQALPVDRFDDLLAEVPGHAPQGELRPSTGVWHFIAATVRPEADGLHLGRKLVAAALAWLDANAPEAAARTLSPAVGLPGLCRELGPGATLADAVLGLANARGQPALEIVRLHLGAGATLEAILPESRRDERRSGGVTLRFAYDRDPAQREAQRARYAEWLVARAADIAAGRAQSVGDAGLWRVATMADPRLAPALSPPARPA